MFKKFLKENSGNVALMTAIVAVPLLLAAGGAVEYSNLYRKTTYLQSVSDAAVLAVAREGGDDKQALEKLAREFLDAHLVNNPDLDISDFGLTVTKDGDNFEYDLAFSFTQPNSFLQLGSIPAFKPEINSSSIASDLALEVVMVLDSTGSMANNNKMPELIKAVNNFATQLETVDKAKAAIVPFDTQVKLQNVAFNDNALEASGNPLAATADCTVLTDQTEQSLCEGTVLACASQPVGTMVAVSYTVYTPVVNYQSFTVVSCGTSVVTAKDNTTISANVDLLGVDETNWSGCVIDRQQPYDVSAAPAKNSDPGSLYPSSYCGIDSLQPILPLTSDMDAVRTHANNLTPSGNTNLTIGIQWGMEVLSSAKPFTESQNTIKGSKVKKFMIVLTDGVNTQNRFTTVTSEIDARALEACINAKPLVETLYTIRVIDGNETLLKQCASSTENYFNITSADQLDDVFAKIANDLLPIRLTN